MSLLQNTDKIQIKFANPIFKILCCQLFLERRHYISETACLSTPQKIADLSLVKLTRAHDLVSRVHEIRSHAHDLLSHANEFVSCAHDLLSRAHDLLSRAHDLVSRGHELVSHAHDIKYFTYMSI